MLNHKEEQSDSLYQGRLYEYTGAAKSRYRASERIKHWIREKSFTHSHAFCIPSQTFGMRRKRPTQRQRVPFWFTTDAAKAKSSSDWLNPELNCDCLYYRIYILRLIVVYILYNNWRRRHPYHSNIQIFESSYYCRRLTTTMIEFHGVLVKKLG